MNIQLLAKALGRGVEHAALLQFDQWQKLLASHESIRETVVSEQHKEEFAVFEALPIQELVDDEKSLIEVRVVASDGDNELVVYFYSSEP